MIASSISAFFLLAALASLSACSQKTSAVESSAGMAAEKTDAMVSTEKAGTKTGRTISAHRSLDKAGLKITKVQDALVGEDGKSHGLDVYVLAESHVRGRLGVLAFDMVNNEIGRASVEMKRIAGEGKFQRVVLSEQVEPGAIARLSFAFQPDSESVRK